MLDRQACHCRDLSSQLTGMAQKPERKFSNTTTSQLHGKVVCLLLEIGIVFWILIKWPPTKHDLCVYLVKCLGARVPEIISFSSADVVSSQPYQLPAISALAGRTWYGKYLRAHGFKTQSKTTYQARSLSLLLRSTVEMDVATKTSILLRSQLLLFSWLSSKELAEWRVLCNLPSWIDSLTFNINTHYVVACKAFMVAEASCASIVTAMPITLKLEVG